MKAFIKSVAALLSAAVLAVFFVASVSAETEGSCYKTGDIIEFGTYPQSIVSDETLVAQLNGQQLSWVSFGYYSGNGEYGSAQPSDFMKYADVEFNGEKYRAIKIDSYRPSVSRNPLNGETSYQKDLGLETDTVYWYKFEPVKWVVLDPESGYLLCNSIVDSQPFRNVVYYDDAQFIFNAHYADAEFTVPANDYETSYIKSWLENDFKNIAFDENEKAIIISNPYLSIKSALTDENAGFNGDFAAVDAARTKVGSDYAKSQGLLITEGKAASYWWLGDKDFFIYQNAPTVNYDGCANTLGFVDATHIGVCPSVNINLSKLEYTLTVDDGDGNVTQYKYKCGASPEISAPEKAGYRFTGWEPSLPSVMPAADVKVKAVYEKLAVKDVEIAQAPDVSKYFYKDDAALDTEGLAVKITYEDGSTEITDDISRFEISGFSADSLGKKEISVTYEGVTDTFSINVKFNLFVWFRYIFRFIFGQRSLLLPL